MSRAVLLGLGAVAAWELYIVAACHILDRLQGPLTDAACWAEDTLAKIGVKV